MNVSGHIALTLTVDKNHLFGKQGMLQYTYLDIVYIYPEKYY